ncbi:ATP-dependent helicase, partial [candidate division KSB1 bacterium]
YEKILKANKALDFDDLLIKPIELFEKKPEVLLKYQKRFHHILVDEFQDTNKAQYILLKLLTNSHKNLYVVGDDDQSIYGWRGAEVSNILDFQKDFRNTQVFRLEQNYRSTQNILNTAYSVIKNNTGRMDKRLWTDNNSGNKVKILEPSTDNEEALMVTSAIHHEVLKNKLEWEDFAVLYRTNSQSRTLEKSFIEKGIPYSIVGGTRFYERKEIKDIIAYLHLIVNGDDDISFLRVINFPARGIGKVTIDHLKGYANKRKVSLFNSLKNIDSYERIGGKGKKSLENFYKLIRKYRDLIKQLSITEHIRSLIDELKIKVILKEEGTEQSLNRLDNIQELINAVSEYAKKVEKPTLEGFLQEIALYTDIDTWNDKTKTVSLMTLHCSKGLEFPVVFITGVEEGLFPLIRENFEYGVKDIEEERRLFYVGATRARKELYISYAQSRFKYGDVLYCTPSRFIEELDKDLVEYFNGREAAVPLKSNQYKSAPGGKPYKVPAIKKSADSTTKKNDTDNINIGKRVKHPSFGRGIIITRTGDGDDMKVMVEFEDGTIRKLMVKYAKLSLDN